MSAAADVTHAVATLTVTSSAAPSLPVDSTAAAAAASTSSSAAVHAAASSSGFVSLLSLDGTAAAEYAALINRASTYNKVLDRSAAINPVDRLLSVALKHSGVDVLRVVALNYSDAQFKQHMNERFNDAKEMRKLLLKIGLPIVKAAKLPECHAVLLKAVGDYRLQHRIVPLNFGESSSSDEGEGAASRRKLPSRAARNKSAAAAAAASSSSAPSSSSVAAIIPTAALEVLDRLPSSTASRAATSFKRAVAAGKSKKSIMRVDTDSSSESVSQSESDRSSAGSEDEASTYSSPPHARRAVRSPAMEGRGHSKHSKKSSLKSSAAPTSSRRPASIRDLFPASASNVSIAASRRRHADLDSRRDDKDSSSSSDDDGDFRSSAPAGPRTSHSRSALFPSSSAASSAGVDHLSRREQDQVYDELDRVGIAEPMAREWIESVLMGQGPTGTVYQVMKYNQKFNHVRNARECQAWARVIDAMLKFDSVQALELAVRRCAGVQAADMSNNWDMCDQFELVMENQSYIPARFMARVAKAVTRLHNIKKGASTSSSSAASSRGGFKGGDGKKKDHDGKSGNNNNNNNKPSSGATGTGRSNKK
jgi:hypothetical protein